MMKKFASALVALCLMMATSLASASDVILFKKTSGEGWSAFEKDLKNEVDPNNRLVDGVIPVHVLALGMHGYVKKQSLLGKETEDVKYIKLFKQAYSLGDKVAVDEFRRLGQAGHFALSTMTAELERQAKAEAASVVKTEVVPVAVAQAPAAATLPVTAASASVATYVATEKFAKLESDLANLKEKWEAAQKAAEKAGIDQKQINAKIAEIDALNGRLDTLSRNLDDFAKKGEVSPEMRSEITEMQTKLENLDRETNSIIGKVEVKLNPRFSAIEDSVGLQNKASGFFAAMVVLIGAAVWFNWRRTTSAKEESAAVKADFAAVKAESVAAMAKATAVENEVVSVKGRVTALELKPTVVLPTDFDYRVDALRADGPLYEFSVYTEDDPEKEYLLSIELDNSGYSISGIKDLTTMVSRKSLKTTIYNAAVIKDGQNRFACIKADGVVASAKTPLGLPIV